MLILTLLNKNTEYKVFRENTEYGYHGSKKCFIFRPLRLQPVKNIMTQKLCYLKHHSATKNGYNIFNEFRMKKNAIVN